MRREFEIPTEFETVRQSVLRALGPVRSADSGTRADGRFLFDAKRSDAGRQLPPYYLVYFLLVEFLGFRDLGQFEKVSWSVPLDFHGQAYLIEHRKLGLGLFVHDPAREEVAAAEIVMRIKKAVKLAKPFFDWLAKQAVSRSEINVVNNSYELYGRFEFLRGLLDKKVDELKEKRAESKELIFNDFEVWKAVAVESYRLDSEINWLAISSVEAFFSWTEHVLIHVAIVAGRVVSAQEVADLALGDWSEKFKAAISLSEESAKKIFDELVSARQELRNYVAHGAFGKQGEAFYFHSGAGAVPVLLPHNRRSKKFVLGDGLRFDTEKVMHVIDGFVEMLWSGERAPAKLCVQETKLPTVLTFSNNGTYASAMVSDEAMREFVEYWTFQVDRSANMDW